MRRTLAVFALVLSSLAAALFAAVRSSSPKPRDVEPAASQRAGALRVSTQLERRFLREAGGEEAYLQIDVAADPAGGSAQRVPVNAVLIVDRSGSMEGEKVARARDAARALIAALNGEDRLAIVDFASDAHVLVPSTPATEDAKARAVAAVDELQATTGTNLSGALDLAAPELARGRAPFRMDKIFLASDGQANEGVADRAGLLRVALRDFGPATTVSTFGVGEDYDEGLMTALAAQAGGRTRFIRTADELLPAFRAELARASTVVARGVRLDVRGLSGARVLGVLGYAADGGWIRLPDFAAGEERRIMVKLALPPGHGILPLAHVELLFADAAGADHRCETAAEATFTADRAQLGEAPTAAAANGARVEMAQLAEQAADSREKGDLQQARNQLAALRSVSLKAQASAPPKEAAVLASDSMQFDAEVNAITGGAVGGAAGKKVKQRAFDAARAPVQGW